MWKILLGALVLNMPFLNAQEAQVVKLSPPTINSETVLEEIVCVRPFREGECNISLEHKGPKTIVHCYGHGPSGWTLLFGSVDRAIDLYAKSNPDKKKPIRVIGGGCMGLTTAIELHRRGYKVAAIYTKSLYDNPSWRAGAFFSVTQYAEESAYLNDLNIQTFLAYKSIKAGKHPYVSKEAVRMLPVYCNTGSKVGLEYLEEKGYIPPRKYVTLDFGKGVIHPNYVEFMSYYIDTYEVMRQLIGELQRIRIPIVLKYVKNFDELNEEIIFNCSGLGSKDLNNDEQVKAMRGHIITLKPIAKARHMDYMICTMVEQDGQEECIYLFPKTMSVTPKFQLGTPCQGVLGGTFLPDVEKLPLSEQRTLDRKEFKKLLDRNCQFFHGHPFER